MKYLHTLDPDDFQEIAEQERRDIEDMERAFELMAEDAAMDRYYNAAYATV